jgi:hypothetical protein
VLAAALLVLLPSGAGAVVPTVFTAPYTGMPNIAGLVISNGCAVKLTTSHAPTFTVSTGRASGAQKVTASPCGAGPGGMDSIRSIATIGYQGTTFKVLTSGHHTATAKWTLSFSDSLTATPGNFSQQVLANAAVGATTQVLDLTNGSTFSSSSRWTIANVTTHGSSTFHVAGLHLKFTVNATLNSGHNYEFFTALVLIVFVEVTDTGSSVGSASVSMAGTTNGAKLVSLSIA